MKDRKELLELTADIVSAHVSNNTLKPDQLFELISSVHRSLSGLGQEPQEEEKPEPIVPVRSSIKPSYLVCLACGKKAKTLKRHIAAAHGMTPDEYREAYDLRSDYPMVAADYTEKRRQLAKDIGLGRKPGQKRGKKKAR